MACNSRNATPPPPAPARAPAPTPSQTAFTADEVREAGSRAAAGDLAVARGYTREEGYARWKAANRAVTEKAVRDARRPEEPPVLRQLRLTAEAGLAHGGAASSLDPTSPTAPPSAPPMSRSGSSSSSRPRALHVGVALDLAESKTYGGRRFRIEHMQVPDSALDRLTPIHADNVEPYSRKMARGEQGKRTYGHLQPRSLAEVLSRLEGVCAGDLFVDLGSGAGSALAVAAAVGLNGIGVELDSYRYEGSERFLHVLQTDMVHTAPSSGVQAVDIVVREGSFIDDPLLPSILSQAKVLFANDLKFGPELSRRIAVDFVPHLPHGAYVVSHTELAIDDVDVNRHSNRGRADVRLHLEPFERYPVETSWSGKQVEVHVARWMKY